MALIDLSRPSLEVFFAQNPVKAFVDWFEQQTEQVQTAYSGIIGPDSFESASSLYARWPKRALSPLKSMLFDSSWLAWVDETERRAGHLLGDLLENIDIILLVGFGPRNASQGFWQNRGLAFVWLEHFLPPGTSSGFLDLGVEQIPVWLGHEIAHAARYMASGSSSPVRRLMQDAPPADLFRIIDSLPLAERLIDEGLATAFSRFTAPDQPEEHILFLPPNALEFLEQNEQALGQSRKERYDFSALNPPLAALDDLFHFFPDRLNSPWTLERPPTRWGYWWGDRIVRLPMREDWPAFIGAPTTQFEI